ncbi:unnamed protein product [Timema podura]|uniref:Uncharacterized protein n=1 Tax=Timema podura TaxID=61482 RepID=A0ABN7NL83_TIMPD|nr:unnamed protein product [Timema podura]
MKMAVSVSKKVAIALRPHGLTYNGLCRFLELILNSIEAYIPFHPSLISALCHVNKKEGKENYETSYLKVAHVLKFKTKALDCRSSLCSCYISQRELIEMEKGKPCSLYIGHSHRSVKIKRERYPPSAEVNLGARVADHKCVPDEVSLDVKRAVYRAKKRAREDSHTPIFQLHVRNLDCSEDINCQGFHEI